jgi:cytochrome bd-type quinol oxidase subunit 2
MLVTLGLSVWFYSVYAIGFGFGDTPETSALLHWTYIILTTAIAAVLSFSVWYFVKNRKKIKRTLLSLLSITLLFTLTFILSNGKTFPIQAYEGHENTWFWQKVTDMWIYSIVLLLAATFFTLIGGILWSYLKKIR